MTSAALPDDIDALKAALLAERDARQQAEARAAGAEAMIAHLKLVIAKLKRDRFGRSAERGRQVLDQLELQLEELEAAATEDACVAAAATTKLDADGALVRSVTRRLPAHLPRERVVVPSPPRVPAAVASSPSSARTSPRRSRWSRAAGR